MSEYEREVPGTLNYLITFYNQFYDVDKVSREN